MTLQEKLDAALDAKHRLILGDHAVEVDTGNHRTVFQKADIGKLDAYIAELRSEIAGTPMRGAIGIVL